MPEWIEAQPPGEVRGEPAPVADREDSDRAARYEEATESAQDDDDIVPLAPLDIRVAQFVARLLAQRPRWSERPPSKAEIWEYSINGDWTTEQWKRVFHNGTVLLAMAIWFVPDWLSRLTQEKPSVFWIVVITAVVAWLAF